MAHCFARRCRAARKDFLAARRAAFRASAVSGSSSLDPSSSGRTLVTPGIHDLNEFKIAEKFLRIELSSVSTKVRKIPNQKVPVYLCSFVSLWNPQRNHNIIFHFSIVWYVCLGEKKFELAKKGWIVVYVLSHDLTLGIDRTCTLIGHVGTF